MQIRGEGLEISLWLCGLQRKVRPGNCFAHSKTMRGSTLFISGRKTLKASEKKEKSHIGDRVEGNDVDCLRNKHLRSYADLSLCRSGSLTWQVSLIMCSTQV